MDINEFTNYLSDKIDETVNKLLIDDIFDISNGLYNSYADYVEHKQEIIEMIREHNDKYFNPYKQEYVFTYYTEPVILNKKYFDYIVSKK